MWYQNQCFGSGFFSGSGSNFFFLSPDPDGRIRIQVFKVQIRISEKTRIHPDPDPKHWSKQNTSSWQFSKVVNIIIRWLPWCRAVSIHSVRASPLRGTRTLSGTATPADGRRSSSSSETGSSICIFFSNRNHSYIPYYQVSTLWRYHLILRAEE